MCIEKHTSGYQDPCMRILNCLETLIVSAIQNKQTNKPTNQPTNKQINSGCVHALDCGRGLAVERGEVRSDGPTRADSHHWQVDPRLIEDSLVVGLNPRLARGGARVIVKATTRLVALVGQPLATRPRGTVEIRVRVGCVDVQWLDAEIRRVDLDPQHGATVPSRVCVAGVVRRVDGLPVPGVGIECF
jgi:hypothetical protein